MSSAFQISPTDALTCTELQDTDYKIKLILCFLYSLYAHQFLLETYEEPERVQRTVAHCSSVHPGMKQYGVTLWTHLSFGTAQLYIQKK